MSARILRELLGSRRRLPDATCRGEPAPDPCERRRQPAHRVAKGASLGDRPASFAAAGRAARPTATRPRTPRSTRPGSDRMRPVMAAAAPNLFHVIQPPRAPGVRLSVRSLALWRAMPASGHSGTSRPWWPPIGPVADAGPRNRRHEPRPQEELTLRRLRAAAWRDTARSGMREGGPVRRMARARRVSRRQTVRNELSQGRRGYRRLGPDRLAGSPATARPPRPRPAPPSPAPAASHPGRPR